MKFIPTEEQIKWIKAFTEGSRFTCVPSRQSQNAYRSKLTLDWAWETGQIVLVLKSTGNYTQLHKYYFNKENDD